MLDAYICMFADLYACVHDCASKSLHSDIFLSLMCSQGTMGALPQYLFVRQPDECNWQSYIIISQRLCFTPGAGMRGIVDSCRRKDNWVN